MKSFLTILFSVILLFSCANSNVDTRDTGVILVDRMPSIGEATIEGCQYLYIYSGNQFGITHKGNCTNLIHNKIDEK